MSLKSAHRLIQRMETLRMEDGAHRLECEARDAAQREVANEQIRSAAAGHLDRISALLRPHNPVGGDRDG